MYADYAVLRGDPSDGLPGLKGVGAVTAAGLINRHGGVAGMLRDGALRPEQRDYLARAMRVVQPVPDVPIELPTGHRSSYPADSAALESLVDLHGLRGSVDRLLQALVDVVAAPVDELS
jgi:5'-3' exonuclease